MVRAPHQGNNRHSTLDVYKKLLLITITSKSLTCRWFPLLLAVPIRFTKSCRCGQARGRRLVPNIPYPSPKGRILLWGPRWEILQGLVFEEMKGPNEARLRNQLWIQLGEVRWGSAFSNDKNISFLVMAHNDLNSFTLHVPLRANLRLLRGLSFKLSTWFFKVHSIEPLPELICQSKKTYWAIMCVYSAVWDGIT